MSPEQQALLEKAAVSLRAANLLAEEGIFDFAASRAYYTMFYVAEAFLLEKGLAHSTHAAVISAFGKEFAKTGAVPAELHRYLIEAGEARAIGDYETLLHVPQDRAVEHIKHAEMFLNLGKQLLAK